MPNTLDLFSEAVGLAVGDLLHLKRGTGIDSDKRITEANLRTALVTLSAIQAAGIILDEDNMASNDAAKAPSQQSVVAYINAVVDAAVAGLYDHKGAYDADTNTPDLDTAPSGIMKGDAYTVSVAGTFFAVAVEAGDVLIADQDDPVDAGDWTIVNRNIDSSAFATAAQGVTADSAMQDLVDDTTPQLGGSLDVNGQKIVSASNGDIDIEPNGTGDVLLGNLKFDADQTIGAGQDNYVLTYDHSTGKISLEFIAGGGGGILNNFAATADPAVGDDDVDGYSIGSWWLNITDQRLFLCENASTGAAVWLPIYGHAGFRVVSGTTDTILSTDSGKLIIFTNAAAIAVTLPNTFPVGFQFTTVQTTAAGIPTTTRSGADTINGAATGVAPSAQWKGAYFMQYSANTWLCLK